MADSTPLSALRKTLLSSEIATKDWTNGNFAYLSTTLQLSNEVVEGLSNIVIPKLDTISSLVQDEVDRVDAISGTLSTFATPGDISAAIQTLDGAVTGSAGAGKTLTAFSQADGKVTAGFGDISILTSQISNFPTIPTVNDGTLKIQKNGSDVATFNANQSNSVTANIAVPLSTSQLANDSGYLTSSDLDLAKVMEYQGTVTTYADLPANPKKGAVYDVISAYNENPPGTNYAWNGTTWDPLGGTIDTSVFALTSELFQLSNETLNGISNVINPKLSGILSVVQIETDRVDEISSNVTALSAAVPLSTSQLVNDSGFLASETDPIFNAWLSANRSRTIGNSSYASNQSLIIGNNSRGDYQATLINVDNLSCKQFSRNGTSQYGSFSYAGSNVIIGRLSAVYSNKDWNPPLEVYGGGNVMIRPDISCDGHSISTIGSIYIGEYGSMTNIDNRVSLKLPPIAYKVISLGNAARTTPGSDVLDISKYPGADPIENGGFYVHQLKMMGIDGNIPYARISAAASDAFVPLSIDNSSGNLNIYSTALSTDIINIKNLSGTQPKKYIVIGHNATLKGTTSYGRTVIQGQTIVGLSAGASNSGTAIGYRTSAANVATALGTLAIADANYAIQLGKGINSEVSSLQVYNWQLLDGNGNVPEARISSVLTGYAHSSDIKDGTLTIQKNGSLLTSFSANQSGNITANIDVPLSTSQLINDSNFLTTESDPIFNTWLSGDSIVAGNNAQLTGTTTTGIVIGAGAQGGNGVCIGLSSESAAGVSIGRYAKALHGVSIGISADSSGTQSLGISIGREAKSVAGENIYNGNPIPQGSTIAVGYKAKALRSHAIAIGSEAETSNMALSAIQLGNGVNSTQKSLQVWEYQLLDGNGNVPEARISAIGYAKTTDLTDYVSKSTTTKQTINSTLSILNDLQVGRTIEMTKAGYAAGTNYINLNQSGTSPYIDVCGPNEDGMLYLGGSQKWAEYTVSGINVVDSNLNDPVLVFPNRSGTFVVDTMLSDYTPLSTTNAFSAEVTYGISSEINPKLDLLNALVAQISGGGGSGSAKYAIVTPEQTIDGTRSSISVENQAINQIALSSTITSADIYFPEKETGYARDFFIRLTLTGSDIPAITFKEQDSSPVEFDVSDDSWAEIEPGVNVLMFTETAQ